MWTLIALRKEPALIGQFLADPRIKAGIQNLQSDPFYGEKIARAANPEHYALVELLGQAIRYEGGNPEGLSLNQGYMDLLQSIIQHPSFSKIWELVKKFLKDIGIDLSSKDLAKLSLEEFLEYASQEVKSGESLSDATRQQLLDFLEGKTSSVHISDRSILGTQEAKEGEGITMEDWYANTVDVTGLRDLNVVERFKGDEQTGEKFFELSFSLIEDTKRGGMKISFASNANIPPWLSNQGFDFVVTNNGILKIGRGHGYMAGNIDTPNLKAAGKIFLKKGKIIKITTRSGHFQPEYSDIINILEKFQAIGLATPDCEAIEEF